VIRRIRSIVRLLRNRLGGHAQRLGPYLPMIFDRIDTVLPRMLGDANAYEVEELFARAIQRATGQPVTRGQVDFVAKLYNPITAAARIFER
jgi:hypothetical protein